MFGENGNDLLYGSVGSDFLNGGAGNDTFIFDIAADYAGNLYNRITDFNAVEDAINIDGILDANYDPLTDILSNFVQIVDTGSDTYIRVDENGAGVYNSVVRAMN